MGMINILTDTILLGNTFKKFLHNMKLFIANISNIESTKLVLKTLLSQKFTLL
jgi:hypothetical protein